MILHPCFCSFKVAVLCLSKGQGAPFWYFCEVFLLPFLWVSPPALLCLIYLWSGLTLRVHFNQQKFIFSSLWKLKSKIKVSARLVSSEDSLLVDIHLLAVVTFWPMYVHECVQVCSSYTDNSHIGLAPSLPPQWPNFNWIALSKDPSLQIQSQSEVRGVRASLCRFWEGHNSAYKTVSFNFVSFLLHLNTSFISSFSCFRFCFA